MLGPGKYDDACTSIRTSTNAKGCILIVLDGTKGSGSSCQADLETTMKLPSLLRHMADQIEQDMKQGKL